MERGEISSVGKEQQGEDQTLDLNVEKYEKSIGESLEGRRMRGMGDVQSDAHT